MRKAVKALFVLIGVPVAFFFLPITSVSGNEWTLSACLRAEGVAIASGRVPNNCPNIPVENYSAFATPSAYIFSCGVYYDFGITSPSNTFFGSEHP